MVQRHLHQIPKVQNKQILNLRSNIFSLSASSVIKNSIKEIVWSWFWMLRVLEHVQLWESSLKPKFYDKTLEPATFLLNFTILKRTFEDYIADNESCMTNRQSIFKELSLKLKSQNQIFSGFLVFKHMFYFWITIKFITSRK
jgi:hypothetical protein